MPASPALALKPNLLASEAEAAHGVARSDAIAVNAASNRALYKKRQQIYPKAVSGFWRKSKWAFMAILLGLYYLVPFLRWDRPGAAPDQFLLFDFAGRRFYMGAIEIWPQELYYVTGLMILAAIGLFLASALFGRVWCGFACPQTVWTDLFIAVEQFFEGDRNQRMRLDKQKWDFNKAWRKLAKHIVWLVIAMATGGWFVAYFHDAPTLFRDFFRLQAPLSAYVFAAMLTATTYVFAGTLREQVCTYMCPWPRIQAAMLDQDALSVTYRYDRGEPRGAHKKNDTWNDRGDCIDCRQCIAACPAGIDIRDGLQIECINCALCIDACDEIMVKVDRPKGLIAYDTVQNIERRRAGETPHYRFIRARTLFYGLLFVAIAGLMVSSLMMRPSLEVNVLRDRAPLFVPLSDGHVRNAYTIKVLNKAPITREFEVHIEGIKGGHLVANDLPVKHDRFVLRAGPDRVAQARVFVTANPHDQHHGTTKVMVEVRALNNNEEARSKSVFISARHEDRDDD